MTRNLSVWNSLRPFSVGFDSIFEEFDRMLESTERYNSNYPPYNIRKEGDYNFVIELALAGLSKDDLEIEVADGNLSVRSKDKKEEEGELLHRGISYRKFSRSWTLADDVVVNEAKMENGMLLIYLEHVVPEEKKPRLVKIK